MQRKINAAMKLLTDIDAGVHKIDDTILNELKQKHPQPAPLTLDAQFIGPVNRVLPSSALKLTKLWFLSLPA